MIPIGRYLNIVYIICFLSLNLSAKDLTGMISGKVLSSDGEPIDYANVYLKGTNFACSANEKGLYHLSAPQGDYTIVFSAGIFYAQGRNKEIICLHTTAPRAASRGEVHPLLDCVEGKELQLCHIRNMNI